MNGRNILALLAFTLLGACTRVEGPLVTQTRDVPPFTSIELRGSAQLDVLVGEAQSVTVEADEASLRELRTTVNGERLVIDTRERSFWMRDGESRVRITVPNLEALALNGATTGSVHGLAGEKASLILSGAGDLEVSGSVGRLIANVNGAGNLDLAHLVAGDATVVVNGTGNVRVQANDRLDATVNGVGNIEYLGKPRDLETAIHGVGSIEPRESATAAN
jgi:hypothetical protein